MAAIRIYRQLQELKDVDPNGLPDQGVPQYRTNVSSFVVAVPATAGAFSMGVTDSGNTAGDTGVTGPRVGLVGSGNLTLLQSTDFNGGTITISAGTAGGGGFSAGISGGNTAGDTGATGSRLVLAGGNNVTLSGATDANGGTVTIVGPVTVAQSVQTQHLFDMTLDGNTAGVLALVSSGTLTLAGGSNITLSQNGNAITILGPNQSVQTQNLHDVTLAGNTAGALALVSSGTLTLAGGNSITISQNGNAITISGATTSQSVQTQPIQTGISSIVASNATYTSGSVQFTGSGIVTVRSSANQRVVIDATQSVQTQNAVDVTAAGNTAGVLALVSSGTMTLAGGNNITLSQAGNAITISGANVGGAQTGISGIANSQTTYTSGTVTLSELGAITIRSTTGNQFQLSVAPQSVQPETQTFLGGLAGSNTTYTSGTVTITGVGGGITVSSNTGQRIDLSVAAQSVQPGIQNLVASNTTFSSGTVSISGFGAATVNTAANIIRISVPTQTAESQSIGMSNLGNTSGTTGIASGAQVRMLFAGGNNVTLSQSLNGASGTITISAASQTVQTQNMVAVTLSGNTSGAQALISSGTLTLAGGNNITVSQAGNAVTISGPNVGGAQTGISGIVASDATYTSGTVEFTGSNMVTVKSSAGQRVVIDATQSVQSVGLYALGNTTGQSSSTTMDARTLSVAGDGAVSVGYSAGSLRISAPTQTAESQSIGMSNVGNTSGTTGVASGAQVRFVLAGGNNVTLSQSLNGASGTLTISAFNQSVQPGIQNLVASDATFSSGTVSISGFGDITVNTAANLIRISGPVQTAESQSIGMSNIGNTSGTTGIASGAQVRFLLAGGNNITLSQSLNGASGTITISAPNAVAQTVQTLGMYAVQNTTGQSSSTTMDARTLSVAGDGAVSVGYSAGSLRISAPVQTGTQFSAGISGGNTAGDTGTVAGRVVLAGGANITLSGSTNGVSETISIIGGAGGAGFSAGMSTEGNTAGATGVSGTRMVLVGSGPISLSQTTGAAGNTVSILGPGSSVLSAVAPLSTSTNGSTISFLAPAQFSGGVSTGGNTAGDTGAVTARLVLAGGANITLSGSTNAGSQTLSIVGGAGGGFSAGVSTGGNTAGATGVSGTRMVLVGTNAISLSQTTGAAGNTVSIDAPATSSLVGVNGISISTNGSTISISYGDGLADWENMPRAQASLISHVSAFSKTPIYWNDHIDGGILAKSLAFAVSLVTASQPLSVSVHLGIYTFANSTSANRLGSVSEAFVVSSASSASLSGVRNFVMTGIGTHATLSSLTNGEYMIGMMFSATATNAMNFSLLGASGGAGPLGGIYPGTNALSAGTSQGIQALAGRGSTTVNAMPANVVASEVINQGQGASMQLHPWIYIRS